MQVWTVFELTWCFKRDKLGRQVKTRIGVVRGPTHAAAKAAAQPLWPGKCLRLEQQSGPPAPSA